MDTLARLVKRKNTLRVVLLAFIIVSMRGPWAFERLYVPAGYECGTPFLRLEGNFCGYPMPGRLVFSWFVSGFFSNLWMLVIGRFTGHAWEFLLGLALIPLSPFITVPILNWEKVTPHLLTFNLVAWTLALILTLFVFVFGVEGSRIQLWGLWLYILAAMSAVILEILAVKKLN